MKAKDIEVGMEVACRISKDEYGHLYGASKAVVEALPGEYRTTGWQGYGIMKVPEGQTEPKNKVLIRIHRFPADTEGGYQELVGLGAIVLWTEYENSHQKYCEAVDKKRWAKREEAEKVTNLAQRVQKLLKLESTPSLFSRHEGECILKREHLTALLDLAEKGESMEEAS